MVDLVAPIVDRVSTLRHAKPIQQVGRLPAGDDCRVGDHTNVNPACVPCSKGEHQVGAAELVYLHQHPSARRLDESADKREYARVLPQANGLGETRARGRLGVRS